MIKVTIIGTGNIANIVGKAMKQNPDVTIYAVVDRDEGKAKAFGEKFGAKKIFSSSEQALADENTDLVYVALPHGLHYSVTKQAILCGKNVLCEKPLAINSLQAKELLDLAREKKVFLSEAMWTRFLPQVKKIKEMVDNGAIGDTKLLSVTIGGDARHIPRMTEPSMAGGMLLDSGIYAVTTMELLLGEDVADIKTTAVMSEKGVDLHSSTIVTYKNETVATLTMAMDCNMDNRIVITGDKGRIEMNNPFNWCNITLYSGGAKAVEVPPQSAGGYEYEVEAVCRAIQDGKLCCSETSPQKTLFVMEFMDKLRKEWGLKYPTME